MKVIAALALLVAAISALPSAQIDERNARLDQFVIDRILDLSERIRDRGLDPYHLRRESASIGLPGDRIMTAAGLVEDVTLDGLSNIVINSVNYDAVSGMVSFDLLMPGIVGSVGNANGALRIFDHVVEGEARGRLAITDISARGLVNIAYGVTGIVATDATVMASIGNIESNIYFQLQVGSRHYDMGQYFNTFFNDIVLKYLASHEDYVNRLIAYYLVRYINRD